MGTPLSGVSALLMISKMGFSQGGPDPPTTGPADQRGQKGGGSQTHVAFAGSPADNRLQALDPLVKWGVRPPCVRVLVKLWVLVASPPRPGALTVKRRHAP
ncbi:hypothetical protein NDU88_006737 [Pleurodeles waltl]|uniref:Uncharacterized protein n=1 Tax=Pleurodeles waltl TaxID=8319 RepID=A0AAV7TZ80_PLEWA|nr:hypothetical protein NDU88_006737 [Pleurodeles waltl]